MGAGKYRWWEEPPLAHVKTTRAPRQGWTSEVANLYVAGVHVDLSGRVVLEQMVERINRAKHHRTLRMEAELERAAVRAVEVDQALDVANALAAASDEALYEEFDRRQLHVDRVLQSVYPSRVQGFSLFWPG